MGERIEIFELMERLDAASRDETLADGMLYRAAAERLAEYISRDVNYWRSIMSRTDKQADRIRELEKRWELMRDDRNKWKARVNEPFDDSYIKGITAELKQERADYREAYREAWALYQSAKAQLEDRHNRLNKMQKRNADLLEAVEDMDYVKNLRTQLEAVTDILYGSKHADIEKLEQIEAAIGESD